METKTKTVLMLIFFLIIENTCDSIKCPDFKNFCTEIKISGGTEKAYADTCTKDTVADFEDRDKLEQFPKGCRPADKWGPKPIQYPTTTVPEGCDSGRWQRNRVLAVIKKIVAMKLNYCHHHAPNWVPPKKDRKTTTDTTGGNANAAGQCSEEGLKIHGDRDRAWKGIDCTHYTSFVYNYAFGCYLVTLTGNQACGPNAAGKILPYGHDDQKKFLPGDLIFIAKKGSAVPLQVSHGIIWTGYKMGSRKEFAEEHLIENMPESQRPAVVKYIEERKKAGKDVYVISDSHHDGPNYRPFAGWYINAFSHARRLINPDTSLPSTSNNLNFVNNKCENSKAKANNLLKKPVAEVSTQ